MDRHHTNVSIAYAVISIAGAFHHAANAGSTNGRLAVGVLSRAPGDGAPAMARNLGIALGMEVLDIRTPQVEYHTGAMSVGVGVPFERAVANGKPVLVILDEAHSAQPAVLEALAGIIAKRVEDQPVTILAISTMAGERHVAEQLAEGLGWDVGHIALHRTDTENRRLVEGVVAGMGG